MKTSERVIFDIGQEKFKYLQRDDQKRSKRVDVNDLNRKLNQSKRINIYNNTIIIALAMLLLGVISLLSLNF
jgi:hypothetical protein